MTVIRGCFLLTLATMTLASAAGAMGRSPPYPECPQASRDAMVGAIHQKLFEKHPNRRFEVSGLYYVPGEKLPFWHAQATTLNGSKQSTLFAMVYCDRSVELTALATGR